MFDIWYMADRSLFNDSIRIIDPSQQKRKKARAQLEQDAQFYLQGKKETVPCTLTDLGTGGLSFISKSTLYTGDKLTVRFKVKTRTLEIPSVVVRVAGKSSGVQFTEISEQDLALIQDFIHTSFFEKEKKKP